MNPNEHVSKQHEGARIIWRHWWNSSEAREGYVREFSPTGKYVRIAETDLLKDKGDWFDIEAVRLVEVLAEKPQPQGSL